MGDSNLELAKAQEGKIYAILCYLGPLFLVALFGAKDSRFAQYHANQGLLLFIVEIAAVVLRFIPLVGWLLYTVIGIVSFVFMILGIINAAKLEMKPLPIIGDITLIKSF